MFCMIEREMMEKKTSTFGFNMNEPLRIYVLTTQWA